MECSFCPGNEATCHLTKIVNGKVIEVHVCEKCIPQIKDQNLIDFDIWDVVSKLAKAKGMPDPAQALEVPETPEISAKSLMMSPQGLVTGSQRCGTCGFSGDDLRKTGRLGCPECYSVFSEMLGEVLNDCQKGVQHLGKVPVSMKGLRRKRLEEMLDQAVTSERFEEAAIIRDQLKVMEQEK